MDIIIKKVRVVAAPEPVFVGTRLTVVASEGQMTFKIVSAKKVTDRPCIRVDWNDGIVDEIAGDISNLEHTYEKEGVYEIEIGDDIESLSIFNSTALRSPPMLVRLFSNSSSLTALGESSFRLSVNLVEFDLRDSGIASLGTMAFQGCSSLRSTAGLPRSLASLGVAAFMECPALMAVTLPENVTTLTKGTFRKCTSLAGRIDLPYVEALNYTDAGGATFVDCNGITEIHFAASHMESIQSSVGWQKAPNLGAANAVVKFDL